MVNPLRPVLLVRIDNFCLTKLQLQTGRKMLSARHNKKILEILSTVCLGLLHVCYTFYWICMHPIEIL